jgi:hypothetical protein
MLTHTLIRILTAFSLLLGLSTVNPFVEWPAPVAQTPAGDFSVEFFPVAPYHSGDVLSARVTYTGSAQVGGTQITIALADDPDQVLGSTTFSLHARQAIFYWFLDTSGIQPGFLNFQFTLPDTGFSWTQGIQLLPNPGNRHKAWSVVHSNCCTLHYLTGTDAEADLTEIIATVEARTARALEQFAAAGVLTESPLEEPLVIVLIPVVVGHGGFATDEAVLTYTHRNWTGIELGILVHHEVVHVIDRLVNTVGPRPSIFVEGLAVYLAGGHYQKGDPLQRAAALLALDLYLPITDFVDDFYAAQHEIGYMQAAALVAYLDQLWGWETLIDFYFNLPEGPSDTAIISGALETRFGYTLAELEANFIAYLQTLEPDPNVEADVRLTIVIYDMLRRYQTLAIPSAHFRTAWWPPLPHMRAEGIVGDYAYREKAPLNIILEDRLQALHGYLADGQYDLVEETLQEIDRLLGIIDASGGVLSHYTVRWPLPARPRWQARP